ncbi:UNKNOWN [Stylonychia lemnae]|uniref:Uncharacterized protein n=1 Tax=Stylonychia lemnae TaxID=5949 RepID=A0A077ZZX0_STYLE|nr:UNKNOWN [Stylonychia lemnae]|eukprot:CDW75481.1 UNKNOWN [Stylonychia lemnae]
MLQSTNNNINGEDNTLIPSDTTWNQELLDKYASYFPFNLKFSQLNQEELNSLMHKNQSGEGENKKEYFLQIRSFIMIQKNLKQSVTSLASNILAEGQQHTLDIESLTQFIDQVIFNTLLSPQMPLPQNRDEFMQTCRLTYLQEYVYAQYQNQAKKANETLFSDSQSQRSSILSGRSSLKMPFYSKLSDFFSNEQDAIQKSITRPENENILRRLYYLRWYQCDPIWKTYSESLQKLDEEFQSLNQIVNDLYNTIEKNDDKEDYQFSILKMGCIVWKHIVQKTNRKQMLKSVKVIFKSIRKDLKNKMMKNSLQKKSSSQDSDKNDSKIDDQQSPMTNRLSIVGMGHLKIKVDKLEQIRQALQEFSSSLLDISFSPTSVYYLASTQFITEDTPYQKLHDVLLKESKDFTLDELILNKNLHENLKILFSELEKMLPPFSYKSIQKSLIEMCLNSTKEKINRNHQEITKELKKRGANIPAYSKKDDESCYFKGAVEKYIKGKQIPLIVQQQLVNIISKDEQSTFNLIFFEYMKSKKVFSAIDEKVIKYAKHHRVRYDQNDCSLSKKKYRFSEIQEDVGKLLISRHRTSLGNVNLQNINQDFVHNQRNGRSSLVPFRMTFNSIVDNSEAQRRSELFKDLNQLDKSSNVFQGCNINYGKMLGFFQGGLEMQKNSLNQQHDQLPSFNKPQSNHFLINSEAKRSMKIQGSKDGIDQDNNEVSNKQRSSSLPPNPNMKQTSNEYYQVCDVYTKEIEDDSQFSAGLTRLSIGINTQSSNKDETGSNFDQFTRQLNTSGQFGTYFSTPFKTQNVQTQFNKSSNLDQDESREDNNSCNLLDVDNQDQLNNNLRIKKE